MNINENALSHYKNDDFWLEMVNGHPGNYIQHVYWPVMLLFFFSRFFFVLHSLVIIIQMVHISRLVAPIDVTDPFLHSCWSRRKEICRVTWHNCNLAFVHAVCHHFIYVSLSLSLYIYITLGHDTAVICFFCVS